MKEYDPVAAARLDEEISAYSRAFVRDAGLENTAGMFVSSLPPVRRCG